ncbi:NAD-dependent epimerase/dehydratase family protein, partial [Nocardia brasiliensis]|uniref:NAD-dependent epimerase/dehydratase family protein n=1 Tax=Nocardia brasiliensis TaxID=37326 RepID=UPI0024567C3C
MPAPVRHDRSSSSPALGRERPLGEPADRAVGGDVFDGHIERGCRTRTASSKAPRGRALSRARGSPGPADTGSRHAARRRRSCARSARCRSRVRCDIGDQAAMPILTRAFAGADAVVHLAWAVQPRVTDPPLRRTNHLGSANVLRAAAACGVTHLTCASSVAAYTPAPRWQRVDEQSPLDGMPHSAHSRGKAALEAQIDAFALAGPGGGAGPGGAPPPGGGGRRRRPRPRG